MENNLNSLFVYGSLKPHELAFEQISKLIQTFQSARLRNYEMYLRDGLPFIARSTNGGEVKGFLLEIDSKQKDLFWDYVTAFEGDSNYRLEDVQVKTETGTFDTKAFVGKKVGKGRPIRLMNTWDSAHDPILKNSYPLLHQNISKLRIRILDTEHDPQEYWEQMNTLLSYFLLLVSIVEHLTVMKYGGSKTLKPMERINQFQKSKAFQDVIVKLDIEKLIPKVKVSDSRSVEDSMSTDNHSKTLSAWYQVRSNLQHRGKMSLEDGILVHRSCVGICNFLLYFLKDNVHGIQDEWQNFLGQIIQPIPANFDD